jgi:tetratricopeptide (TPR) repeat protein
VQIIIKQASAKHVLGAAAIVVCGATSLVFRWVSFALSDELYGFSFPVVHYSPSHAFITMWSFGVIGGMLFLALAIMVVLRKPGLQCACGGMLVLLLLWAYLQVAVGNAELLFQLARESAWLVQVFGRPTPHHPTVEPSLSVQLSFDTVYDRMWAAFFYMGLGWYIALFGAICIFINGARLSTGCSALRPTMLLAFFGAVLVGLALARPLAAESALYSAVRNEVEGRALEATKQYQAAMQLDDWYTLNPVIYARIGRVFSVLGDTSRPEYQIFRAEEIYSRNAQEPAIGDITSAIDIYQRIKCPECRLGTFARIRTTELLNLYGYHLFRTGAFGQAVQQWDQVLETEPDNWLAVYYLGLGYPAVRRYQDLATLSQRFIKKCADPLFIGILYNNLGDADTWLGRFGEAHWAYYNSYKADFKRNSRAVISLVGP